MFNKLFFFSYYKSQNIIPNIQTPIHVYYPNPNLLQIQIQISYNQLQKKSVKITLRPSCRLPPTSAAVPASQLRLPLQVSATCAGPYLAAASHTTTIAAHTYSTAAIARTSTLPWSAGSTEVLAVSISDVASVWVRLVSPVGLICV